MTEVLTRAFDIEEVNEEAREVTGIAVPFDTPTEVGGYTEQFDREAITSISDVKLFWNHSEVIGKVIRGEATDTGYQITALISKTPRGDEAYTLLRDGVVDKFSVGFIPLEQRTDEESGAVVRTKVQLREVSLVPFPAYQGASISEVRSEEANKTKEVVSEGTTNYKMTEAVYDDSELRSGLENLERRFEVLSDNDTNSVEVITRSGGEILKGLAAGNETIKQELRALPNSSLTNSVVRPAFVQRGLKLIEVNRKAYNLFTARTLDSQGMSVEYPVVASTTGSVGVQAVENDALTLNNLVLTQGSAPVKTYGGGATLSRQVIERSSVDYLNTTLDLLARNYARATNAGVMSAMLGASANTGTGITLATSTAINWLNFVLEGSAAIEDNGSGAKAEFIVVSRDVFNKIALFTDLNNRPLFVLNNDGTNTIGSANLVSPNGYLAGAPIIVDALLPAKTAYMGSAEAIEIYESAGAPYALAEDHVLNLTKDFALYGYMAVAVPNPKALFKVTVS